MIQPTSAGRRQRKKSRRRAAIFSRAYSISAALIFRAAVSLFARHGRALTGVSPEHAQIVGSV